MPRTFSHRLQPFFSSAARWVDAKNSTELTRRWYASHLRFPLNFYYPSVWKEAARRRLAAVCDFDASPEAVEAYVGGLRTPPRHLVELRSSALPRVFQNRGVE